MYQNEIESEIISKVRNLNGNQKTEVLNYLERIPNMPHSTKRYRRKAMKQIREALRAS
ncbi:MAG: hypothetical protein JXR10_02160 [Cyclobacteriaceae bacterium]